MTAVPSSVPSPVSGELAGEGRRAWAALEVVHVPGYFSRDCRDQYAEIGLHPALAYFAARSAAMGAVAAEVVEATFYVFAPRLVRQAVPECWGIASPEQVLAARHEGVSRTLHRLLDGQVDDGELTEAVELARLACEGLSAPGRALYAGHASLAWPADPLMQLWHASTLLREHRGDGHVAALTTAALRPIEASLTAALAGAGAGLSFLRKSRGWTDAEWDETAQRLREQGIVQDGDVQGSGLELTAAGQALRDEVEASTDLAALAGWSHLGVQGTRRLTDLVTPWARTIESSGILARSRPRA